MSLKTPKQVQAEFRAQGINVSQWCREHGLHRNAVADLLRGRLRGHRGHAHRAAVLLGMKPDPGTHSAKKYHNSGQSEG